MTKKPSRYASLIENVFFQNWTQGAKQIPFEREQFEKSAAKLGIKLPKNVGDMIYSFRYRRKMPEGIIKTQPKGWEWVIEGAGHGSYRFKLDRVNRITPNIRLIAAMIPDATPEIVAAHSLSDEQALLAKVRYNRLLDIFLGMATYSLQSHLRTTAEGVGQVEIDEIYVAIDRTGAQYIVPVQAKAGSDQLSAVQARQDILCCQQKFPNLACRSISAQFLPDDRICLFELALKRDTAKVVDERHYKLVPSDQIPVK